MRICLLAWIILLGFEASATLPTGDIYFRSLDSRDGLSNNGVLSITQDSQGFVWFGTQNGLNRFDGQNFRSYFGEIDEVDSLQGSQVFSLLSLENGVLLVGTQNGLSVYSSDTEKFRRMFLENGDEIGTVRVLFKDSLDNLWAGTSRGLFAISNSLELSQVPVAIQEPDSRNSFEATAIHESSDGVLWLGTNGKGLFFKTATGGFQKAIYPDDIDMYVRDIMEDPNTGDVLLSTSNEGLVRLRRSRGNDSFFAKKLSGVPLETRQMTFLNSHEILVGSPLGLLQWDISDDSFHIHKHIPAKEGSLKHGTVTTVYKGAGNVFWVATLTGVSYWRDLQGAVLHLDPRINQDVLSDAFISAITETSTGTLLASTFTQGLVSWVPGDDELRSLGFMGAQLSDFKVSVIAEVNDELWIGTHSGGINVIQDQQLMQMMHDPHKIDSLSSNSVTTLFLDSSDRLWVGTYGGGLNLYLGNGKFRRIDGGEGISFSSNRARYYEIAEDREGRIWLADEADGLVVLDPRTFETIHYRNDSTTNLSLPSNQLLAIEVVEDGVWVGFANHGLAFLEFESEEITKYFELGTISAIVEAENGDIWASGTENVYAIRNNGSFVESFGAIHGFRAQGYNPFASLRLSSGLVAFGGESGIDIFDPTRMRKSDFRPQLHVTEFERNHKKSPLENGFLRSGLQLTSDTTSIGLTVASLDYTAPEKNLYRYKLEGFDQDWIDNGTDRTITYTNLDPGEYLLHVQGSNSDGIWNPDGLSLPIVVASPWWATWWAVAVYALLSLAAFYQLMQFAKGRVDREADRNFNRRILRYVESLDDTGELVLNANSKGNVLFTNMSSRSVLGKTTAQMMGRSMFDALLQSSDIRERAWQELESSGKFHEDVEYVMPESGEQRILDVSIAKSDDPGEDDIAFVSIAREITANADAVQALQESHDALELELADTLSKLKVSERYSELRETDLTRRIADGDELLRTIHDRVNDNFQMLASLLNIQSSKYTDQRSRKLLDDIQQRLTTVSLVHENLLHVQDLRKVEMGSYLDSLATMLHRKHAPKDLNIRLIKDIQNIRLDIDQAVPAGLVINELLTNAFVHGFSDRTHGNGAVRIELYQSATDCVCMLSDDGQGLPASLEGAPPESMGLEIVSILVDQLGGSLRRVGGVGTIFEFRFPITSH